ncbi:glycosyltransferase family 2 protein [Aestuariibius insulae]|uniref:glycosyltransferase family 2 protein n=1 Tax=Aestuariibius insulae TaxID=2058287 RepID=UPI00345E5439
MSQLSVLTIARGRNAHLANMIEGLCRQKQMPRELVLVAMQDDLYPIPQTPFPVRQIRMPGAHLPLAAARNAAAAAATGDRLVFLDVDCIPAPSLIGDYDRRLGHFGGLLMGEVMYLPRGAAQPGWSYGAFDHVAERHSDRRGPPEDGLDLCRDYRCFWSLNFALHRRTFEDVGGFDERFTGYGGEDTDFGKMVDRAGHPIAWMAGARVYHQYHPHHMPPVHHLDSVLRNAQLFAQKWGYRTMEHWLRAFRLMGLVGDGPDGLVVLRRPGADDFALTSQDDGQPYVNTATVLRYLEARETSAASPMVAE